MMDLNAFDTIPLSNAGVRIALNDIRSGRPTPAGITIYGTDSDKFQEARTIRAREISERMIANGNKDLTAAELDELACKMLAACTKGWDNISISGTPVEFSEQKAVWLYKSYPAIREQVNRAMGDRANFLQA